MSELDVCALSELPPGSRRIVEASGRSIGVFNVAGSLYAIRNTCPHQGRPLCEGTIGGTMIPSEPHRNRARCWSTRAARA